MFCNQYSYQCTTTHGVGGLCCSWPLIHVGVDSLNRSGVPLAKGRSGQAGRRIKKKKMSNAFFSLGHQVTLIGKI